LHPSIQSLDFPFVSSQECDAASTELMIKRDGANAIDVTASAITSSFIVNCINLVDFDLYKSIYEYINIRVDIAMLSKIIKFVYLKKVLTDMLYSSILSISQ
jgi:hypothetical protein